MPAILDLLRSPFRALGTLIYPPVCVGCHTSLEVGEYVCARCLDGVQRVEAPFCGVCSQPFDGAISGPFQCSNCAHRHFNFECAVAAYRSRGLVRELLHRFKYSREFYLRHPLGEWLCDALQDPRLSVRGADIIVPVPLHPARRRERHFNQSEVLARPLADRADVPLEDCLRRTRYTSTQTRLDRSERMENLHNAFRLRKNASVKNKHILLVDDVFTTGSTADECARVLMLEGAASVRVAAVARG